MGDIIDASTPLQLQQLLGSLLTSIIDAQVQSAQSTIDFINGVGFKSGEIGEKENELRSVKFVYFKSDENGKSSPFVAEIPLLGMVDIPVISIKTARIEFSYEVTYAGPTKEFGKSKPLNKIAAARTIKQKSLLGIEPAEIQGRVCTTSKEEFRGAIKFTVEIEKSPVPAGVSRALDILEIAVSEKAKGN